MRALSGLVLLALCATGVNARTIGEKAVEQHIRPAYERLAAATEGLSQATGRFCNGPRQDREMLNAAFKQALLAWAGVEHMRFGPIATENRYERFSFWPDPKGLGHKQLAAVLRDKDESVTTVESLRQKSVALQGLTAYETLFWGADAEKLSAAPEGRDFVCAFAASIAANLSQMASGVRNDWAANDGFAANLLAPGEGKLYRDDKDVLLELFKAFRTGLEQTRNLKLNRVLMGSPQEAQPRRAAFWRSGNAIAMIEADIEAIEDLYREGGLAEIVRQAGTGAERSTNDQFDLIETALGGLTAVPIAEIAKAQQSWGKLNAVVFGLINIQATGGNAIVEAAELPMTFNALDGD